MKIRRCVIADFEPICRLLLQLWPGLPLDKRALKKTFARAVKSRYNHYLCAVDGGAIVGFCSLSVRESLWQQGWLAHVDEIVVDEKHRNRGIGSALLEEAAAYAKRKGCARVELDSAFHRRAAHRFYEGLGFAKRAYMFSKALSPKMCSHPARTRTDYARG
jgi:glucosamine-phosphate N-acetyltransferase